MTVTKLSVLAMIAAAGTAGADLQEFKVTGELLMPYSDGFSCLNPSMPGVSFEYFDVRQPPEAQPVESADGNFLIIGDCEFGGSFPRNINIGNCPDSGGNIRFAHGGPSTEPGTLYDVGGNALFGEIQGPYPFAAGEAVGPNAQWQFGAFERLGWSQLWTRTPQFDITDEEFRSDIDWVGNGIIIGLEITEADGVHYGWIEIERLTDFDPARVSRCSEPYRVVRYAYETEPGVPAPVTNPCLADVNGDGIASPSDFTAWVGAFNNNEPGCDQNNDGACTPTDFSAWVANFNDGC